MSGSQNDTSLSLERVRRTFDGSLDFVLGICPVSGKPLYVNPTLGSRARSKDLNVIARSLYQDLREPRKNPKIESHQMGENPVWVYWEKMDVGLPDYELFRGVPFLEKDWAEARAASPFDHDTRVILVLSLLENPNGGAPRTMISASNPAADLRFHGGSARLSGTPFEMSLPGWYLEKTQHLFRSSFTTTGHTQVDICFHPQSHSELWMRLDIFSSPTRVIVFHEEIPSFYRSTAHMAAVFDFFLRLPELVVAVTPDGKILMHNFYLESTLGYPPKEIRDRSLFSLTPTHDVQALRSAVAETLRSQLSLQGLTTDFYAFNGSRLSFQWNFLPSVSDSGEKWVFCHARPISRASFSPLDEEADRLQILTTAKMASLGEMAAGLAHEINNPLAIIAGRTQLLTKYLMQSDPEPERVQTALHSILGGSERIAQIIKELRAFARDSSQDPLIPTPLNKILEPALTFSAAQIRSRDIHLDVDPIPPDLTIQCRSQQIAECVWNLLSNARDAVEPLTEKWIHLGILDFGQFVEISITDSGSGLPEGIRDRFLQPFFTTKEAGKGTGLGLSVTLGILQSHQGELYLDESSPHTRFVMRLPKTQEHTLLTKPKATGPVRKDGSEQKSETPETRTAKKKKKKKSN